MDIERAKQLLNSPNNIQVFYKDKPIWIESVNEGNKTAAVTVIAQSEEPMNIPVNQLKEA